MSFICINRFYQSTTRCFFKQILEAIPDKTTTVQPFTSHLTNHPIKMNKTYRALNYKLISGILLWTPAHGHTNIGWPARTYIYQLSADTGCSLEDLLKRMEEWDRWRERERERERESLRTLFYQHNLLMMMTKSQPFKLTLSAINGTPSKKKHL